MLPRVVVGQATPVKHTSSDIDALRTRGFARVGYMHCSLNLCLNMTDIINIETVSWVWKFIVLQLCKEFAPAPKQVIC